MSAGEKTFGIFGLSKKIAIGCKGGLNTKEAMNETKVFNREVDIEVIYNISNNGL